MSAPLLLDLSHTSHTTARTGIQRVTRGLAAALAERGAAITYDPFQRAWRPLETWEKGSLHVPTPATKRGARWPLRARLRGHARRLSGARVALGDNTGLLMPELFSPAVAQALPALFAQTRGPRVALFHDALALQLPEFTPTKTVARFPAYLRELTVFDGIAAVSADSRDVLLDYWRWAGLNATPPVLALPLPLGTQPDAGMPSEATTTTPPRVLCVSSIEGRKNHLALLEGCERLWAAGHRFELHLIGLAQAETGRTALAKIEALRAAGRPLRYDGAVDDATLEAAYRAAQFTVYPSLREGFGLPVLESLAFGKPCICSGRGALGEAAQGGGCLTLETVDADAIAHAMNALFVNRPLLERLVADARRRRFRTWPDYTRELENWIQELPRRGAQTT